MAGCRHAKFVFLESGMLGLHDSNKQCLSYYCVRIPVVCSCLSGATDVNGIGRLRRTLTSGDPQAGAAAGSVGSRVHTRDTVGKLRDAHPHVHTRARMRTHVQVHTNTQSA